ncbi:MAG: aspartyl protease family protein [Candidatus Eremiobacteraeota bacterium]|nr:aspartyl protease family protein [Candidatus Eremiobacteraeota bacterium]
MRRLALLCALLCIVSPAYAQQSMTVDALRSNMLLASGKPPPQYREETVISTTGSGVYLRREFRRGDDYRIVYGTGPFQRQSGRLGGKEWDQDANGVTTVQPATGTGRIEATATTATLVSVPFKSYRLATLDAGGFGTVQYVDTQSYRIVREDDLTPAGKIVKSFDNYKTVDGYTMAYRIVTDNEVTGAHTDADVITFGARDIADSDLAIPPSRDLVTFPAGVTSVMLPASFQVPRFDVQVTIAGKKLTFLLDTASPGISLDPAVARQMGLFTAPQNARTNTSQTVVPEIRVGDLSMKNVVVALTPVSTYSEIDTQAVGTLGYDFMRGAELLVDYRNKRITAYTPDHFPAPAMTPNSDILPLGVYEHAPLISARINGALAYRVIIDTGAPADMVVLNSFLRRYPEITGPKFARAEDPILYGGAKLPDVKGYRFAEVVVGRIAFNVIDVAAVDALGSDPVDIDAAMGYGLLDEFAVGFDYAGGKLYLVNQPPRGK